MGRLSNFFFLIFFVILAFFSELKTASEMVNGELSLNLAVRKHKHRHSGFSAAECPGACQYRCSKTAYKKACLFFCQKCCFKCRCVPPGTYGHKEVCPCYNNWKTQRGGPKCP
ncbi:gibberellin-regulated protein 12-like isoform X2 [Phalaenopsis equestris]|uniref:gibberellin-regulated protein 12-like isoform X2 n=1 Tax=Phalaenopsis equestris TaxID=78828 RepID=UPI0009E4D407|nr:gibberellin-regulated protein 12-like isoform X2 [Phalaenopsis equestris]